MDTTNRILTPFIGERDSYTLDFYLKRQDGYQALKKAIAMAYVPPELASVHSDVDVDVRGRISKARVVPLPFYKRKK
jgi:hypothetical protein